MPSAAESETWQATKERLTQAAAAIAAPFEMTAEQANFLLEERARELAKPLEAAEPSETSEHLIFTLSGIRYALPANRIFTVCRSGALVPVPGFPKAFLGITSWSGFLIPVADLRVQLNLPTDRSLMPGYLIVLGTDAPDLALTADAVEELAVLRKDEVTQPPAEEGRAMSAAIQGVTRDRVILLDAEILAEDPGLRAVPPNKF